MNNMLFWIWFDAEICLGCSSFVFFCYSCNLNNQQWEVFHHEPIHANSPITACTEPWHIHLSHFLLQQVHTHWSEWVILDSSLSLTVWFLLCEQWHSICPQCSSPPTSPVTLLALLFLLTERRSRSVSYFISSYCLQHLSSFKFWYSLIHLLKWDKQQWLWSILNTSLFHILYISVQTLF